MPILKIGIESINADARSQFVRVVASHAKPIEERFDRLVKGRLQFFSGFVRVGQTGKEDNRNRQGDMELDS